MMLDLMNKGQGESQGCLQFTPPQKTDIAPENRPSQKETHLPTPVFQVQTVSSRECILQEKTWRQQRVEHLKTQEPKTVFLFWHILGDRLMPEQLLVSWSWDFTCTPRVAMVCFIREEPLAFVSTSLIYQTGSSSPYLKEDTEEKRCIPQQNIIHSGKLTNISGTSTMNVT